MSFILPAEEMDARRLVPALRKDDVEEVHATLGPEVDIEKTLIQCLRDSDAAWSAFTPEGMVGVLFGVRTMSTGAGCIWLLGSDAINAHYREFLRQCRPIIADLNKRWPVLWNLVYANNPQRLRWIRWVGCELVRFHPEWGPMKAPFFEFERRLR